MNWLVNLFGRPSQSADIAKARLRAVLVVDHTDISPETLNVLKEEIATAISKHLEIDRANVEVSLSRSDAGQHLTANVPVLGVRTSPSQRSMRRATVHAPTQKAP
jgi:cell division topological specificity factor